MAVAISATVVVLHLVEFAVTSQAARNLIDALHAPGFGLVAVGAMLLFRQRSDPGAAYIAAIITTFLLGVAAEALQIFSPRNADLQDLGWNALGIAGCLAIAACFDQRVRSRLTRPRFAVLLIIGTIALAIALKPAVQNVFVLSARAMTLPVLVSFDHRWEAGLYQPLESTQLSTIAPPDEWPVRNRRVMAMDLSAISYSGIVIDPYPDWTGYDSISFLAASTDGKEHKITIRIHDVEHNHQYDDRFSKALRIGPKATRYEIPLIEVHDSVKNRRFDLSKIARIIVYKADATGDERILIDDFRLEND